MKLHDAVRTFVIPDLHCPFHDPAAVELLIKIIRYKKPERIVFLGDAVDFYGLSSFDKDPQRKNSKLVDEDLEAWHQVAGAIQKAAPNAERYFVVGNHEDRLRRYVWKNAPALSKLVGLQDAMNFDDLGIKFMGKSFKMDGIMFTHGSLVRPHSSYTAKAEHDKHGCSGLSAHTHRLGKFNRRMDRGLESWHECGCLCGLDPEYAFAVNWQQGFGVFTTFKNRDSYHVNLVEILPGYKAIVGDKIYSL